MPETMDDTTWMDEETARFPVAEITVNFGDGDTARFYTCADHAEAFLAREGGGEGAIRMTTFGEATDFEEFACRCGQYEAPTVGNRVI